MNDDKIKLITVITVEFVRNIMLLIMTSEEGPLHREPVFMSIDFDCLCLWIKNRLTLYLSFSFYGQPSSTLLLESSLTKTPIYHIRWVQKTITNQAMSSFMIVWFLVGLKRELVQFKAHLDVGWLLTFSLIVM